jgi:hypothetical protein
VASDGSLSEADLAHSQEENDAEKKVHAIAYRPYQLNTYIEGASLMQWESITSQQVLHRMSFPHELSHLADCLLSCYLFATTEG